MESDQVLLYVGFGLIAIVLGKLLSSWYHEIEKRNRYMEAQIRLLGEIALASNVSETVVMHLLNEAKLPAK